MPRRRSSRAKVSGVPVAAYRAVWEFYAAPEDFEGRASVPSRRMRRSQKQLHAFARMYEVGDGVVVIGLDEGGEPLDKRALESLCPSSPPQRSAARRPARQPQDRARNGKS